MFRIAGGFLDAVRSIQPSEDVFHRTGFEGRFGRCIIMGFIRQETRTRMNKLHLPNEFVEWVFIIIGVTISALAGAGIKTWLDNQLDGSGVEAWAPGVAALVVFFVLAAPVYFWASRSAQARGEKTAEDAYESED